MPLHLIRPTTTPADAARHVDALPGSRWRATAEQHESAVTAAIAMQRSCSAHDKPASAQPKASTYRACANGPCRQGRALCPTPEACQLPETSPAARVLNWLSRKPTPQDIGNAAGTIVGGVIVLLTFMAAASYLIGGGLARLARWGASFF